MSTKLPDLVPFNDPVTVCASCETARCLVSLIPCRRRAAGYIDTRQLPLAGAQILAHEHPSYWKGESGHDIDMPLDVVDLEALIRGQRFRKGPDREILLGYLLHELNIDEEQVNAAMAKEWPDVAPIVMTISAGAAEAMDAAHDDAARKVAAAYDEQADDWMFDTEGTKP